MGLHDYMQTWSANSHTFWFGDLPGTHPCECSMTFIDSSETLPRSHVRCKARTHRFLNNLKLSCCSAPCGSTDRGTCVSAYNKTIPHTWQCIAFPACPTAAVRAGSSRSCTAKLHNDMSLKKRGHTGKACAAKHSDAAIQRL